MTPCIGMLVGILAFLALRGVSAQRCAMEMQFFADFDGCLAGVAPMAFATIYVDGACHTVETETPANDFIYTSMPGLYRAECTSDGTLIFRDSACQEGTCSSNAGGGQCTRDTSIGGSIFASETGQMVQDAANGDSFCETIFDAQNRVNFAIFGDCSLPGCSVDGVTNPDDDTPTTQPSPLNPPPTNRPSAAPVATPPTTNAPATRAPNTARPVTAAPVTSAPVGSEPNATAAPSAAPSATPVTAPRPTAAPVAPVTPPAPVTAPTRAPRTIATTARPTTLLPTVTDTKESAESNNTVALLAGVIGGAACLALVILVFLLRRRPSEKHAAGTAEKTSLSSNDMDAPLDQPGAHEIWFDPTRDDVSTLDGGTLAGFGGVKSLGGADEPTASVNQDFDFVQNRYHCGDERSRASTGVFTSPSKLGLASGAARSIWADDDDCRTFEQQFAAGTIVNDDDDDILSLDMARRVKPFTVRAPPGKLGLVLGDPPLPGGVPLVRLLQPDSPLALAGVQVGDRLLTVDAENVTRLTAVQVSRLLTGRQNHARMLVFCRLQDEEGARL